MSIIVFGFIRLTAGPWDGQELFDAGIYARIMLRIREHGDWS